MNNQTEGKGTPPDHQVEYLETLIRPDLVMSGGIMGKGNLRVGGTIKGNIDIKGSCIVEPTGHVKGDITAKTVTIQGFVEGDIQAREKTLVQESGKVEGKIRAPRLFVADGARIMGPLEVTGKADASS
jgi:cytoskeletal protein CcmA (bactofilin family)